MYIMMTTNIFHASHTRDAGEAGFVSINDKQCWSESLSSREGSEQCGRSNNAWENENLIHVHCQAQSVGDKLMVRVHTNLDGHASDESYAIDNVVVTKLVTSIKSEFNTQDDFEGWNCGKITSCGKYGNVCGGHNVKGKRNQIVQTFKVAKGMYSVALDFVRIDAWYVSGWRWS